MKPLGVAIIILTVLGVSLVATSETVHLYSLIHWPSAVLVLGITLGVLMVWQPATRWRRFLAFIANRSQEADHSAEAPRGQQTLAEFLVAASRSALIAGLCGELLGIVMILTAARNPAALEPGITLATISLLYGFGLSELVFQRWRKRTTADTLVAATPTEHVAPAHPQHVSSTHPSLHEAKAS